MNGTNERKGERERKRQSRGGRIAQWLAYLFPDPAAPGLIYSSTVFFISGKIFNVAVLIDATKPIQLTLKKPNKVDQTLPVLAQRDKLDTKVGVRVKGG